MATKPKKPKIVSKITVVKIGGEHFKILEKGQKVVVRVRGGIAFNNLNNNENFNKWWKATIDALGAETDIDVIKSEVVTNKSMTDI